VPRAPLLPQDEFLACGQGLEAARAAPRSDLPLTWSVEIPPPSTVAAQIGGYARALSHVGSHAM